MSGLIVPQFPSGITTEELADLVAKLAKEVDWFANGNISDQNISIIAGYRASATELKHKSGIVGMSGYDAANPLAVRFWAGNANKAIAPFKVLQNGYMYSTRGFIGGWDIDEDTLSGNGTIKGGKIIGAEIKTSETEYPRMELSALETFFKALASANKSIEISISTDGVPGLFFRDPGGLGLINNNSGVFFVGSTADMNLSADNVVSGGSWTFNKRIHGDITGEASYAERAGSAAVADTMAPQGSISWFQVDKSGSSISQLDTKNLSDLTQSPSSRTVNDTEKSTWNGKASKALPSWTTPTLQSLWGNFGGAYSTAGYYKDDMSIVRLKGTIKSGTSTTGTLLFTLPSGYRPLERLVLSTSSNGIVTSLELDPSGTVTIGATGASSASLLLDGLSFRAEQ